MKCLTLMETKEVDKMRTLANTIERTHAVTASRKAAMGYEVLLEGMKDNAKSIVTRANQDLQCELFRRRSHHSFLTLTTCTHLRNDAFDIVICYAGSDIGRQLNRASRAKHYRFLRAHTYDGF